MYTKLVDHSTLLTVITIKRITSFVTRITPVLVEHNIQLSAAGWNRPKYCEI